MKQIYVGDRRVAYPKRIMIYSESRLNLTGSKAKLFFEGIGERT